MVDQALVIGIAGLGVAVAALAVVIARLASKLKKVQGGIDEISGNFSLWSEDGGLILFNDQFRQDIRGTDFDARPGSKFEDYIRARVKAGRVQVGDGEAEAWISRRLRRHQAASGAFELEMEDGGWHLVNERRTADGGVVVYGVDISDLKRAQIKLADEQARLRGFASAAADWMWETDADHRFSFVTDNLDRLVGWKPSALIGKRRIETFDIVDDPDTWRRHHEVLDRREPFRDFTYQRIMPGGDARWFSVSGAPYFDRDGDFAGYRGVGRDITDVVQARIRLENSEQRLRELAASEQDARIAADRASQAKSDFLASMSHEFRTPLNAILGFGQLLKLDAPAALTEEQRNYISMIVSGGEHLLSLINEILDFAAIEAGELQLNIGPVDARRTASGAIETLRPIAAESGIALRGPDGDAAALIDVDEKRLNQVLMNFLSNAIKYNRPDGDVALTLYETPDRLRIEVADTGFGISEEQHAQVFSPFSRLGAEGSNIEGAGIGLALCRRLVLAMGGEIGFESKVDVGSTFWAEFPTAAAGSEPSETRNLATG